MTKKRLILASSSEIRAALLARAGLNPEIVPARIDEETIRSSLLAEETSPRDIADALAEAKARKIGLKHTEAFVLGCDQIAAHEGGILSKPDCEATARSQLRMLSGNRHALYSAAVLYYEGRPVWRHIGKVSLQMHDLSDRYIEDYVTRNWDSIRHSVGAYKLEEEGVRLFSVVHGDYFHVLGLPLIELLSYLVGRGALDI